VHLKDDARQLLDRMDRQAMSGTAYDTAWVVRVLSNNGCSGPAYPSALDWLRRAQYPNGSWGGRIAYYHDLIISTLAAIVALAERGDRSRDREAIRRGEQYIHQHIHFLHYDSSETVGFELILPTLLEEARCLNLDLPYHVCEKYKAIRAVKLRLIPEQLIYSRGVTSTHSLEFMGNDLDIDRADELQEENGSLGNSPSATAYFLNRCGDNPSARRYLRDILMDNGGTAMPAHPIEIFNKGWVLYNLALAGLLDDLAAHAKPHLDALYAAWDDESGVGFSETYSVPDLDDTALVFKLLYQSRYDVNPEVFTSYERESHFMCYPYERNPSIGAHIHLLDALRVCPSYGRRTAMMEKALQFCRSRLRVAHWFDKWHVSPYYTLSHAIIAAIGHDNELAREMLHCLIAAQRQDGSWGYFGPSSEETAYCLQALALYHREVAALRPAIFHHAAQYLYERYHLQIYPALWIEKCLYTPQHIVRSAIISALSLYESIGSN